jgi:hypothetical protein
MSTSSSISHDHADLNTPQTIDPAADAYKKLKEPHFYRRLDDGSWGLVAWLANTLEETSRGRTQREFADTLISFQGFESRADAAVSCDHAWFPQKECAEKTPDGKKHMVTLTKTHCYMPTCPGCQDERERLDYFLYRDKGDLMMAAGEIIADCVQHGLAPMVARIRLTMPPRSGGVSPMMIRRGQEEAHDTMRRWRDRLVAQHNIPTHRYGVVISDLPSHEKSELWVLYIGPDIPFESLRDTWKSVAGANARFWHSRRSNLTIHDTQCSQEEFEGMIEAELQHIFTLPHWMREADGKTRAVMQVAFSKFQFIRQAGLFYGYRQPIEHVSELDANELEEQAQPISDEELYELCNIPVTEVDCCVYCSGPLSIPQIRRSGHVHDFHKSYAHVSLQSRRQRQEHKHITVSMCGERARRHQQLRAVMNAGSHAPPT